MPSLDLNRPAKNHDDPEESWDPHPAGGHLRTWHGWPEGRHEGQRQEEGGAEACLASSDIQWGEILRGERKIIVILMD